MSGKAWAIANLFRHRESNDRGNTDFSAWLGDVRLGIAQHVGGFDFVPLVRPNDGLRAELTLDEAVAANLLEITERDRASVNDIVAKNRGRQPVLIVEGETLVGCKQNRVVAHSILVPPGAKVEIPVGCMEQGRWRHVSHKFRSGGLKMDPASRASTMCEASRSRRRPGATPKVDQRRLWSDVQAKLRSYKVRSSTADYHEAVLQQREEAERKAASVTLVNHQVGTIALWQGALAGIELAGHPETWQALARRTIGSYVFSGQLFEKEPPTGRRLSAGDWLAGLAAASPVFRPGLGLGTDLELTGPGFVGAGIWLENAPSFVAVFPKQ